MTITDVARGAGVSKSTVSLVLRGSPLIAPATAQRVRQSAAALGYVYNRPAADLRRRSSNMIGIVINDLANPFFAEMLVGMERRLVDSGFISLMAHTDERLDVQDRVLTSMNEYHAQGLIVCPAFGTPPEALARVSASGVALIIVVREPQAGSYDFVGADHQRGIYEATRHLIERGHRRIGFLGRLGAGPVYDLRRAGYEQAMREKALPIAPPWYIDIGLSREGGRAGVRQALALDPALTAAVCYNDVVAFGAMSELGEHGLAVGRDFAVTGFDGVAAAAHSNPPLTTADAGPGEMGRLAADALLERLSDPGLPRIRRLVEPKLIVRQSSGPPGDRRGKNNG